MRRSILLLSAVYFVAMILLAVLIHRASPGPVSQEILGVGIGSYENDPGVVYLSGRRLACDRVAGTQALSSCTVQVAGQTLEITGVGSYSEPTWLEGGRYSGTCWLNCHGVVHEGSGYGADANSDLLR